MASIKELDNTILSLQAELEKLQARKEAQLVAAKDTTSLDVIAKALQAAHLETCPDADWAKGATSDFWKRAAEVVIAAGFVSCDPINS